MLHNIETSSSRLKKRAFYTGSLLRKIYRSYNETPTKGPVMNKPALAQAVLTASAIIAVKVIVAFAVMGRFS